MQFKTEKIRCVSVRILLLSLLIESFSSSMLKVTILLWLTLEGVSCCKYFICSCVEMTSRLSCMLFVDVFSRNWKLTGGVNFSIGFCWWAIWTVKCDWVLFWIFVLDFGAEFHLSSGKILSGIIYSSFIEVLWLLLSGCLSVLRMS